MADEAEILAGRYNWLKLRSRGRALRTRRQPKALYEWLSRTLIELEANFGLLDLRSIKLLYRKADASLLVSDHATADKDCCLVTSLLETWWISEKDREVL